VNVDAVPLPQGFAVETAQAGDFEELLALRMRAMRESLERLGRFDVQRARERLAEGFDPCATRHIVVDGCRVGFLVLEAWPHHLRLKHFYIEPSHQGRGLGSRVMGWLIACAQASQMPLELTALKSSDANRFYQRHGFRAIGQGAWDIEYLRLPAWSDQRAVRALWAAFEARQWKRARALLRDDLQATWWTSAERFTNADVFIRAQAEYPEGWSIRLIECERLEDGRVLSIVRVDHPPQHFYATSVFRLDHGTVVSIDEYWATMEPPPDWRDGLDVDGRQRLDPTHDTRAVPP